MANLPPSDDGAPEKAAPCVLVVDDSRTNLRIAELMLRGRGMSVETACSAEEAVAKASTNTYALVLLDMRMAGADGLKAAREIRNLGGHNRGVPIVALTADPEGYPREACLAAGMNDLITKPLDLRALDHALWRWCGVSKLQGVDQPREMPITSPIDATAFAELRAGLAPHSLRDLASRFLKESPERLLRLRMAAATGDYEAVNREAHTLKSIARLFGAGQLASAAAEIERVAFDRKDVGPALEKLAESILSVGKFLEREIQSSAGPTPDK